MPVLASAPIDVVKEYFPEARSVVVYQFATADLVSQIQKTNVPTLKWPINWAQLEQVCINESGLPLRADRASGRRFSDEELIAIAASSSDPNGCPEHLVETIHHLNALATFAQDCAQSSNQSDAYERVHIDVTQARAQIESTLGALVKLVEPDEDDEPTKH